MMFIGLFRCRAVRRANAAAILVRHVMSCGRPSRPTYLAAICILLVSLAFLLATWKYNDLNSDLNVALTLLGRNFTHLEQALNAIKSALMVTSMPLNFHIICDSEETKLELLRNVTAWSSKKSASLNFYGIDAVPAKWIDLFRRGSAVRLFLTDILPTIDKVLYADTDVIITRPLEELWSYLDKMTSNQMLGVVMENNGKPGALYRISRMKNNLFGKSGFNAGVLLMDLKKMRRVNFTFEILTLLRKHHKDAISGDQCILNAYGSKHKDRIFVLPCEWNIAMDIIRQKQICESAKVKGLGILHGTAMHFYRKSSDFPEFLLVRMVYQLYNNLPMCDPKECVTKALRELKSYAGHHGLRNSALLQSFTASISRVG